DYQIALKHFSNYYNVVGNVVGTQGVNTIYECGNPYFEPCVYELGYPNIGNESYSGTWGPTTPPDYSSLPNTLDGCQQLDLNVRNTIVRHGNFDYVTNSTIWDPAIPDHTIPDSLYYSNQPSWWPAGVAWPPIGPDFVPMVNEIPAQIRFLAQSTPTPTPTPTATAMPAVTPTATPTPTSGQITLSARRYRVQGGQTVDLSWNGATSNNIDIYRNGVLIATVPNAP